MRVAALQPWRGMLGGCTAAPDHSMVAGRPKRVVMRGSWKTTMCETPRQVTSSTCKVCNECAPVAFFTYATNASCPWPRWSGGPIAALRLEDAFHDRASSSRPAFGVRRSASLKPASARSTSQGEPQTQMLAPDRVECGLKGHPSIGSHLNVPAENGDRASDLDEGRPDLYRRGLRDSRTANPAPYFSVVSLRRAPPVGPLLRS